MYFCGSIQLEIFSIVRSDLVTRQDVLSGERVVKLNRKHSPPGIVFLFFSTEELFHIVVANAKQNVGDQRVPIL